jgi:hypothetical protein
MRKWEYSISSPRIARNSQMIEISMAMAFDPEIPQNLFTLWIFQDID